MSLIRSAVSLVIIVTLSGVASSCSHDSDNTEHTTLSVDSDSADSGCAISHVDTLPSLLREASGIAASHLHDDVLWVNNDGGNPNIIAALDTLGHLIGTTRIDIDLPGMDWEDIDIAPCGTNECLYIADTGDNHATRDVVRILRIPEPRAGVDTVAVPDVFEFRFPDHGHDTEALYVLPGERVYVVTKGRNAPVTLYEYPGSLRREVVTLRPIRRFTPGIVQFPDMITSASASSDGKLVAIRSYSQLTLYHPAPGGDLVRERAPVSLAAADETQGEGVALASRGRIFLVSEKGIDGSPPSLSRVACFQGTEHAPH